MQHARNVPGGGDIILPELAPGTAAVVDRVFGARRGLAEEYASLLAGPALERGLLGPRELGRLWERHLLNCAVVGELVPRHARVIDVGSGAGLPGLALAIARPDLEVTLVDSRVRPCAFLSEAVDALGITDVRVRRARAEEITDAVTADVVTSRAVGTLAVLAGWTLPMLVPGGCLLALKGDQAEQEVAAAGQVVNRRGRRCEVVYAGQHLLEQPTKIVRVVAGRR